MTSEVVIMNKQAVAIATDSAVTVSNSDKNNKNKIYNSANKLFTLSKYHPVGIMIYNNAEFMGVPWITIVKAYRKELGKKHFDTLEEYANDFLHFLQKKDNFLFAPEIQQEFFVALTFHQFNEIRKEIDNGVKAFIDKEGDIGYEQIESIVTKIIDKHYSGIRGKALVPPLTEMDLSDIMDAYAGKVLEIKERLFKHLPLSDELVRKLIEIGSRRVAIGWSKDLETGVVITGFGERDVFPSLCAVRLETMFANHLKYLEPPDGKFKKISYETEAMVFGFAQDDMVRTFMDGIHPHYKEGLEEYLNNFVEKYPDSFLKALSEALPALKESLEDSGESSLLGALKNVGKELLEDLYSRMEDYEKKKNWEPIVSTVTYLPPDELAAMAEALVNITSLKRRVSTDLETVGGPVDVAVISKGDGFIWIKRKHYFDPELNRPFFTKYYFD